MTALMVIWTKQTDLYLTKKNDFLENINVIQSKSYYKHYKGSSKINKKPNSVRENDIVGLGPGGATLLLESFFA